MKCLKKLSLQWAGAFFAAILLGSALTSCEENEINDIYDHRDGIAGLWESVSFTGWSKIDGYVIDEWDFYDHNTRMEFFSEGTYTICEYDRAYDKWFVSESGDWSYSKGMINLYCGGMVSKAKIMRLTRYNLDLDYYSSWFEPDGCLAEEYEYAVYQRMF